MPEEDVKQSLDLIQKAIIALDKKIEQQSVRIAQLERSGTNANLSSKEAESIDHAPLTEAREIEKKQLQSNSDEITFFNNYDNDVSGSGKESATLEENIGGKWFARIGITSLVLGVSFFLKYAFDNNWIGETGRVLIGMLIGFVLLGIGEKTIRKYAAYGQMITGGGIVVLYLSLFSAFNFYHIINAPSAFFAMTVVTIVGLLLSIRYDALALMTVAIIGGFATPLMASTGQNNQIGLLSYVALLDLAILAVAMFKKWHSVNAIGFVGTFLLFTAWAGEFYTRRDLGITMFYLTLFFLIFSIASLLYNLVKKEKSTGSEQLLSLFAAVVYFSASYALLNKDYHLYMGFFAMILAIYYFLWAYLVRSLTPEDENLYEFLAFLTVGFITLSIPVQFKQNIITIGWAIEAVLLMVVGSKLKKTSLITFSLVVCTLAALRYLLIDVSQYNQFTLLIFNRVFFSALVLIVASYLIAYIIHRSPRDGESNFNTKSLVATFIITANVLTIFAISKEISASYQQDINVVNSARQRELSTSRNMPAGNSLKYGTTQNYTANQEKIVKLENMSSIALSLFWVFYAIVLLVVGIIGKYKGVRMGGIILLLLAILKLFFVDLWNLGTLYRIISAMSLGIVLIMISFVYNRYKDAIKEIL